MCSKNRIGPKTVPCGTPESTVTRSDCIPSMRGIGEQFRRYAHALRFAIGLHGA